MTTSPTDAESADGVPVGDQVSTTIRRLHDRALGISHLVNRLLAAPMGRPSSSPRSATGWPTR